VSEFRIRAYPDSTKPGRVWDTGELMVEFEEEQPEEFKKGVAWSVEGSLANAGDKWKDAKIVVHNPSHEKCPRCWRFVKEEDEDLCGRCTSVLKLGPLDNML
jgi:isoleucyl-tRNA synthetase